METEITPTPESQPAYQPKPKVFTPEENLELQQRVAELKVGETLEFSPGIFNIETPPNFDIFIEGQKITRREDFTDPKNETEKEEPVAAVEAAPTNEESPEGRFLFEHRGNALNDAIEIGAYDAPELGGAPKQYMLWLRPKKDDPATRVAQIEFHRGPIVGDLNGFSNESVLVILIDRLREMQKTQFACKENAVALTNLETALLWLQKRTMDRKRRGVEGTNGI